MKERKGKEKKDDGMGLESHKGSCAMIRSRDPLPRQVLGNAVF